MYIHQDELLGRAVYIDLISLKYDNSTILDQLSKRCLHSTDILLKVQSGYFYQHYSTGPLGNEGTRCTFEIDPC